MDKSQIKFGDKLFLYGQFLQYLYEFDDYNYNAVMGYMTVGGYLVVPIKSPEPDASVPGFVVDFLYEPSLSDANAIFQMEMVDVTDKLALHQPQPSGTKVWMPTTL
jgi:hypothetical protein